jgi:Protein of unknown function (DUF3237)
MPLDALPVELLFTLTAHTADRPPAVLAGAPAGTRVVVTAMRGTFDGPRLHGTIADVAGGDWVTARADGTLVLDVRIVLHTDDGADILMTYSGYGVPEGDGGRTIRTAPRFETGDARYEWLNRVQAVGLGATGDGSVAYDVYQLL